MRLFVTGLWFLNFLRTLTPVTRFRHSIAIVKCVRGLPNLNPDQEIAIQVSPAILRIHLEISLLTASPTQARQPIVARDWKPRNAMGID